GDSRIAFVSTLTSESFTLPAKVLGYALRELHSHIPFVIVVTRDISNETVNELRYHNIDVQRTEKIDTPYISDHKATKFQYTKIRLWSMTSFTSLVYNDMLEKAALHNYSSYDGGDQTKRGPMFIENDMSPPCSFPYRPLSAAFNYDIGMYYLNGGRALISPAIIHYTMGPVKPWRWWTNPLIDINQHWISTRYSMERLYNEQRSADGRLAWTLPLVHIYVGERLLAERARVGGLERVLSPLILVVISLLTAFHSVPEQTRPLPAWSFALSIMELTLLFSGLLYGSLRRGKRASIMTVIKFLSSSVAVLMLIPFGFVLYISFYARIMWLLVSGPLAFCALVFLTSRVLIGSSEGTMTKYELVPNKM
ncbi:hypothetical protein PENTCL1PPCAC_25651, partial [Pristionchus entomophagus]